MSSFVAICIDFCGSMIRRTKSLIFTIKYRLEEPDYDSNSNVRFIHAKPAHGNLGDELCSPKHYFTFKAKKTINIVGGGAFSDLGLGYVSLLRLKFPDTIFWGGGQSLSGSAKPNFVQRLPYAFWGVRDIDSVETAHFLPCVSCLHPLTKTPVHSDGILVFINYDPNVSGDFDFKKITSCLSGKVSFLYNNCNEDELASALRGADRVVTNSFHGAYWSLLSGRAVTLIGYSSKFYSLFSLFELDKEKIIKFDRGDRSVLMDAVSYALNNDLFQALPDFHGTRDKLIEINMSFMEKLKESNLFHSIRPKSTVCNVK